MILIVIVYRIHLTAHARRQIAREEDFNGEASVIILVEQRKLKICENLGNVIKKRQYLSITLH